MHCTRYQVDYVLVDYKYAFLFFLFSSSGGWAKIKPSSHTYFHVCIRYMSCFDSTHVPVATAARAAGAGTTVRYTEMGVFSAVAGNR